MREAPDAMMYYEFMARCAPREAEDATALAEASRFELSLTFSADVMNAEDNPPMLLELGGDSSADPVIEEGALAATDFSGDEVRWEGATFPADLVGQNDVATGGFQTIRIANILIDATGGDDRITADLEMSFEVKPDGNDSVINVTSDSVTVANVDQGLEMEFVKAEDKPASPVDITGCPPTEMPVMVKLTEGYGRAWNGYDDIAIKVSSGTIKDEKDGGGALDEIASRSSDMVVYDVDMSDLTNGTDMQTLTLMVTPGMGQMGDDLTLSAMFLETRTSPHKETTFVVSETVVIGNYGDCAGETMVFPFISNSAGFDTGVALINNSKVGGRCVLSWDGKMLDDDDVRSSDRKDVDAKDQTVFVLSMENAGFQGLLSAECTFVDAYGYAFITDTTAIRSGAQGYMVEGK